MGGNHQKLRENDVENSVRTLFSSNEILTNNFFGRQTYEGPLSRALGARGAPLKMTSHNHCVELWLDEVREETS